MGTKTFVQTMQSPGWVPKIINLNNDPLFLNPVLVNPASQPPDNWLILLLGPGTTASASVESGTILFTGDVVSDTSSSARLLSPMSIVDKSKPLTIQFKYRVLKGGFRFVIEGSAIDDITHSQLGLSSFLKKREALPDAFEYYEYFIPENTMKGSGIDLRVRYESSWNVIQQASFKLKELQVEHNSQASQFVAGPIPESGNHVYSYADLNRENANAEYLIDRLQAVGYMLQNLKAIKTDFTRTDFPRVSYINNLKGNILSIIDGFYEMDAPELSIDTYRLQTFDFNDVNAIEENLQALYDMFQAAVQSFKYSGTFSSGQDIIL
ncbi:MAG TPA: hypothetical protein GX523_17300 [Desulfitobacterium dehalogenans]|uniref:Uncharacterized protein n=1 Tax=Desulfitobacterium dehalogenans TaxID=36854 RepID=A0A7C7DC24_9FIRM|nr:hypothetical protein [Desulfitobacterium dehalogenans]